VTQLVCSYLKKYVYEGCKIRDSYNSADEDSSCEIWCVLVHRHQHTQFENLGDWSLQYVLFKCNSSVTQPANTESCIRSCGCVHDTPSVKMTCARWITVHRSSMIWFNASFTGAVHTQTWLHLASTPWTHWACCNGRC